MILQDIKELKSSPRELRKFGLLVGGVFAGLGILFWLRGRAHFAFLLPGVVLVFLGVAFPRSLKPIYLGWMSLAIVLGFIVSHVLLTFFFLAVITPIGLAARLFGKDFLRLKLDRSAPSYWLRRTNSGPRPKTDYERQF
jgi:hypothetical protein